MANWSKEIGEGEKRRRDDPGRDDGRRDPPEYLPPAWRRGCRRLFERRPEALQPGADDHDDIGQRQGDMGEKHGVEAAADPVQKKKTSIAVRDDEPGNGDGGEQQDLQSACRESGSGRRPAPPACRGRWQSWRCSGEQTLLRVAASRRSLLASALNQTRSKVNGSS